LVGHFGKPSDRLLPIRDMMNRAGEFDLNEDAAKVHFDFDPAPVPLEVAPQAPRKVIRVGKLSETPPDESGDTQPVEIEFDPDDIPF
jgi:hypothetical protein